jgi:hypothetical protein
VTWQSAISPSPISQQAAPSAKEERRARKAAEQAEAKAIAAAARQLILLESADAVSGADEVLHWNGHDPVWRRL